MKRRNRRIRARRPRGVALLVAIVSVSIAVAVLYGIVRQAAQAHREVGLQQRRAQARWVLESAVDLAIARLAADDAYVGEPWSISAAEIGGRYGAEVLIEVGPIEGQESFRHVRIVADFPVDLPQRVRQTREFRMPLHP